jgi:hypothetical protein
VAARGAGGWHDALALKDDDGSVMTLWHGDNDGGLGQWRSAAGQSRPVARKEVLNH